MRHARPHRHAFTRLHLDRSRPQPEPHETLEYREALFLMRVYMPTGDASTRSQAELELQQLAVGVSAGL
jgi:hypothetical protein